MRSAANASLRRKSLSIFLLLAGFLFFGTFVIGKSLYSSVEDEGYGRATPLGTSASGHVQHADSD
jgi:hypothetical protein